MIPAIATVSLGGTLEEKLRAAAEAGFQGVELFDTDLDGFAGPAITARATFRRSAQTLLSYFPIREFEGMPANRRQQAFDRAKRHLETATELGAGMVMACSNTDPDSLSDPERLADDLHALAELASTMDLKLAYEAIAWGRHVNDYRVAHGLVEKIAHPNFGLVLDSFHVQAPRFDLAAIATIRPEQIFLVQVSDSPWLALDYIDWSRHHRILPGDGDFPLQDFFAAIRATGYDGIVSLECFSDQLRNAPPAIVARDGFRALDRYWRQALDQTD